MVKKGELNVSIGTILMILITSVLSFCSSNQALDNKSPQIELIQETASENFEIYFCPQDNCHNEFYSEIKSAKTSINCALHEFDDLNTSQLLTQKHKENIKVNLVIEKKYIEEHGLEPLKKLSDFQIKTDTGSKLMHHKFCVIDDKTTITGSMNPTPNGFLKNNNNLVIIHSKQLASEFNKEFNENLMKNKFQTKKQAINPALINLTTPDSENYIIETQFCPNDNCLETTLKYLKLAQKEILFANFVLTEDKIEDLLIEKANLGLNVSGVLETRTRNSMGSRTEELNQTFPIKLDKNKNSMHHKFFVIDETYVITGSMNPSKSGTTANDENLIIIENKKLAKQFKQEFNLLNS